MNPFREPVEPPNDTVPALDYRVEQLEEQLGTLRHLVVLLAAQALDSMPSPPQTVEELEARTMMTRLLEGQIRLATQQAALRRAATPPAATDASSSRPPPTNTGS